MYYYVVYYCMNRCNEWQFAQTCQLNFKEKATKVTEMAAYLLIQFMQANN